MNTTYNGTLIDTTSGKKLGDITKEIYYSSSEFIKLNNILKYIKGARVFPVVKVYLLNNEEQILEDITKDVISGSLSISYQSGQRRSLSLQMINKNNKYDVKPYNGRIWYNRRIRLDLGIVYHNIAYWKQ